MRRFMSHFENSDMKIANWTRTVLGSFTVTLGAMRLSLCFHVIMQTRSFFTLLVSKKFLKLQKKTAKKWV